MFDPISDQGIQIQNTMRRHFMLILVVKVWNSDNAKC